MREVNIYKTEGKLIKLIEDDKLETIKRQTAQDFKRVNVTFNYFAVHAKSRGSVLCSVHGQNQNPVFFFLYYDKNEKLRAFFPKCNLLQKNHEGEGMTFNKIYDNDYYKIYRRNAMKADDDVFNEFYNNKNTLKNMCLQFERATTFCVSKKEFEADSNVNMETARHYIATIKNDILNYVYKDFSFLIDYDEITDVKILRFENGGYFSVPHAIAEVSVKEKQNFIIYLYIDKKKAVRAFVPMLGNHIHPHIPEVCSEKEYTLEYNYYKMNKAFRKQIVPHETLKKMKPYNALLHCGIPYEKVEDKEIEAKESSIGEMKRSFDKEKIEEILKNKFGKDVSVDEINRDKESAGYDKIDIQYSKVYFVRMKCSIKKYHSFYALMYMDKNDDIKITIPKQGNYFYHDELINEKYKTPYLHGYEELKCDIFKKIEEQANEFEIYEVRHARPYGKKNLEKYLNDDILSNVPKDDLREEVSDLKVNTEVHETSDNLDYAIMDYGDGKKICFYLDEMNKLRAYIPYNKDYTRDIEGSIIVRG